MQGIKKYKTFMEFSFVNWFRWKKTLISISFFLSLSDLRESGPGLGFTLTNAVSRKGVLLSASVFHSKGEATRYGFLPSGPRSLWLALFSLSSLFLPLRSKEERENAQTKI